MGPAPEPPESRDFHVASRVLDDDTFWLGLNGRLERPNVDVVIEALSSPAAQGRPVVIDLRGIESVDTIGAACILRTYTRAEREARDLRFVRGPETVQRILELTGIDGLLRYVD